MKIQSLSIVVPTKGCINHCKFCVSRMHNEVYANRISDPNDRKAEADYKKRLEFTRDNNCNTVMLTGYGEPQQNMSFIRKFSQLNDQLPSPFKNIEIQTTGAGFTNDTIVELRDLGITTISFSVSSLLQPDINMVVINEKKVNIPSIQDLIFRCHNNNINARLSLNLTGWLMAKIYNPIDSIRFEYNPEPKDILTACYSLGADQVTFRQMYSDYSLSPQSKWVEEYALKKEWVKKLKKYIENYGTYLDTLETGQRRYSLQEMSVILDEDCMAKKEREDGALKYLVLRPDCKLYSRWDDKGSLIF